MLDWIFEGIVGWVASIISKMLDAVSGLFLEALGTDMTAMEEYFPFVAKAYDVMQVTAYAILILIVIWQLFRAFGGPITEAENPWHLTVRGALFAFLIYYAKPIFSVCLSIARAPYTSLMDLSMTGEDFTFAGVEQVLTNGLATIISAASVVGLILIIILLISLGWNYFKLLLETVERYVVVGVLCYTSPLAFSLGGSKATNNVFRSWCRMVGSQLLLLVMNVWFLRGFASSMGQFIGNGGALSTGQGSIFLWMFCALAYLKCAQRFDSYLASMGLNVAQTGSSMGMEPLMAARVISGVGSGAKSAGSVFGRAGGSATATGTGAAATGFAAGFASRFNPNSYVRDAVVDGGTRMGFSGGAGFVGRVFGGMAARNGATLNGQSISSVASRTPGASGTIAGDIADRSLSNYLPHMNGFQLKGTQITGGHISTTATTPDGKKANVDLYSAAQYEKPDVPHSVVTAADGSQWYQVASGEGRGAFYDAPVFGGMNTQHAECGVHAESGAGADVPGVQPEASEAPVTEGVIPGADGISHGAGTFEKDQLHEEPGASGGFQPEGFVPGGAEVPATESGSLTDQPPAAELDRPPIGVSGVPADAAEFDAATVAETGTDGNVIPFTDVNGETAVPGQMLHPPEGTDDIHGTGSGFTPELVVSQPALDQDAGDGSIIGSSIQTDPTPIHSDGGDVVTETVFPTGYQASGTTKWTVTLTKDTPKNTITINAVNEKITGSLVIQKATNTGQSLGGWVFGVYTDSACAKPISGSPFTTPASGKITITGLVPGTYYVKETSSGIDYWVTDNGVKTVKVEGNSSASVTVTNTQYGYGKIIKKTNTGTNLSGWKFNIYTDAALTKKVTGSPFTTDATGVIVKDLMPGTYYVQEVNESDRLPDWNFDTTVRTLTVTAGSTQSVTFTNTQTGYARIVKTTNTGGSLGGWKFDIYSDAACTKPISGSPFTTDEAGVITVRITPGTYYVREVDESGQNPLWDYDIMML